MTRLTPGPTRPPVPMLAMVLVSFVVGLSPLLVAGRAQAQPAPRTAATDDRIQILGVGETEDEVVLDLAVTPAIGRIPALNENFAVLDDGQLVDAVVAPTGSAATIVLVIDTSGSMRGSALDAAKAAAAGFVDALPDDARVGLISFGETVVTNRVPTLDRRVIRSDLAALAATGQETALWDALLVAAEAVGGADIGRASVVVLSDGDDTASSTTPARVVERFAADSSALYAVAIESPDTDLVALEETVGLVGGQFVATSDVGQLDSLYTAIAGRLANRYQLRFAPSGTGERPVVVSVALDDGVATARTTIGAGGSTTGPGGPDPTGPSGLSAPVLNLDGQRTLGAVVTPAPGPLGEPMMFWVGLGAVFGALAMGAFALARPSVQVRLNAAAGADRLVGINVRLGRAVDRIISRHDRGRRIDNRLEAADINLRPGEFILAWLVVTVGAGLVAATLVAPALGLLLVVVSAIGSNLVLGVRAGRRRSDFADQLTETLAIMASSLRAGQSLPRSIELVAAEAPSPTAEQFHRIAFELRVGRDLTESIQDAADRMDSADLKWLAQAVDINRSLGGDLTEILDNVADTIRERRTVARQIEALSADGRASGLVLLGMPIVLFLFSLWRTPQNIEGMVAEPMGRVLLLGAVVGMITGHLWIRQLVKVKF